jgi:hypothetical protein
VTAAAALARLRALGVIAEGHGDRLTLRPASAIPPDLLAEVRAHKAAVLALLAANHARILQTLPPASPEQAEAADRSAIEAEPQLPAPGTPERDRLDRRHAATVAGLLAGFRRSRRGVR